MTPEELQLVYQSDLEDLDAQKKKIKQEYDTAVANLDINREFLRGKIEALERKLRSERSRPGEGQKKKQRTSAAAEGARTEEELSDGSADLKCQKCDEKKTTTWRPGPGGQNTLCNKCGIAWRTSGSSPDWLTADTKK